MRSLMIIIGMLFALTTHASIQFDNAAGVVGIVSRINCDAELTCAKDGLNRVDISLSGLEAQVASTTVALTAAQCGSTIVGAGAHTLTLPEASTVLGCRYTIIGGTVDDLGVNPADGTDQIMGFNYAAVSSTAALAPAAGDAIQCTDIGASIVIEAIGADAWAVVGVANGLWADIN